MLKSFRLGGGFFLDLSIHKKTIMKIGILVQARTGSTRLPNKMIMPFYKGLSILEILIDRILSLKLQEKIVICTTEKERDNSIEEICLHKGVECFRGSEDDVLKRFLDAAHKFGFDYIVRICADNLFLDLEYLKRLIREMPITNVDYLSYQTRDGKPSILTHQGLWAMEGCKVTTLEWVNDHINDTKYHEHVTNYLYNNSEIFKLKFLPILSDQQSNEKLRLTIDTPVDFQILQYIYTIVQENGMTLDTENIVRVIETNRGFYDIMEKTIQNNQK